MLLTRQIPSLQDSVFKAGSAHVLQSKAQAFVWGTREPRWSSFLSFSIAVDPCRPAAMHTFAPSICGMANTMSRSHLALSSDSPLMPVASVVLLTTFLPAAPLQQLAVAGLRTPTCQGLSWMQLRSGRLGHCLLSRSGKRASQEQSGRHSRRCHWVSITIHTCYQ